MTASIASDNPYQQLAAGYRTRQPTQAASAYHPDARYIETHPGQPETMVTGRVALAAFFGGLFDQLVNPAGKQPLDLSFRFVTRRQHDGLQHDEGLYRLRVGDGPEPQTYYGRFQTRIAGDLFLEDRSAPATLADFEEAPGPSLFVSDDDGLDAGYYDRLLGRYLDPEGEAWTITRSVRRLYALEEGTGIWRALNRHSGLAWSAGRTVLDPDHAERQFRFSPASQGRPALTITANDGLAQTFVHSDELTIEPIRFASADNTLLSGQVLIPNSARARSAGMVLVHGSGPQDRHGYASYLELLARTFSRQGLVTLSYDKRGVGGSGGDWTTASFETLAADASAAVEALRQHPAVDPERVGLGGSSQAGWVTATALSRARPDFVVLIGAAGTSLTVEEQNLDYTALQLSCRGVAADDIALALAQQRAFFAARRGQLAVEALRALTAEALTRPAIRDWLFPGEIATGSVPEWYDVLRSDFDPLPHWQAYTRPALFIFGSLDDSTPTDPAVDRLRPAPAGTRRACIVLEGAQHLGLLAEDRCRADLDHVSVFHPQFFTTLADWVATLP
jgi:hypothetical protein